MTKKPQPTEEFLTRRDDLARAQRVMTQIATVFGLRDVIPSNWAAEFTLVRDGVSERVRLSRALLTVQADERPVQTLDVIGVQSLDTAMGKSLMVDFGDDSFAIRLAKLPRALVADLQAFTVYVMADGQVVDMQDVSLSFKPDRDAWGIADRDLSLTPDQARRQDEILRGESALDAVSFARRHPYAADVERLAQMVRSSRIDPSFREQMNDVVAMHWAFHMPIPDDFILANQHSRYQRLIVWPARSMEDAWLNVQVVNLCSAIDNGRLGPGQRDVHIDLDRLIHMSSRDEIRQDALDALSKLPAGSVQAPASLGIDSHNENGFWVNANFGFEPESQRQRA